MSNIITVEDLTDYMAPKVVPAAVAAAVVDAVNAWIERVTRRCWGDTKEASERHDLQPNVWLRHQDVTEIESVKTGFRGRAQATLDASNYYWHPDGRLALPVFRRTRDFLEVSYTYGVEEVPEDLVLAALGVAAGFANWAADGNKDVTARSVGGYSVSYGNKQPAPGQAAGGSSVTDLNFATVRSYATRRV